MRVGQEVQEVLRLGGKPQVIRGRDIPVLATIACSQRARRAAVGANNGARRGGIRRSNRRFGAGVRRSRKNKVGKANTGVYLAQQRPAPSDTVTAELARDTSPTA